MIAKIEKVMYNKDKKQYNRHSKPPRALNSNEDTALSFEEVLREKEMEYERTVS